MASGCGGSGQRGSAADCGSSTLAHALISPLRHRCSSSRRFVCLPLQRFEAERPPAVTKHSASGKRDRDVPSSSPESDENEGEGEAEAAAASDGGRAGPARRDRDRPSFSAHTRKKARGAVRSDSEEGMGQPPIADDEQTAAAAAAPMAGSRLQASIIDRAAAALSSPSVDPLTVMELLDHSVVETEIGVMQLALQTTDER